MGRIVKYNQAKGDNGRTKSTTFTSSTGYATNDGNKNENKISCNLWGNDFDGIRDIEDSMQVNGDINLIFDADDFDDSEFTDDEGNLIEDLPSGSLYAQGKVEARKSVYGKTIYLDYPSKIEDKIEENEDGNEEIIKDDSNKTDLLDILKNFDNAKIWGQGMKANNYNIVGNMNNVGNINFSGDSKVIGSMSNANLRPNELYCNGDVVVSKYNGNPWEVADKVKEVGAMIYIQPTHISLNSVVDYYNNNHYFNNARINWWVYNPTTLEREGNWWLGSIWHNDYDEPVENATHKDFQLLPSFDYGTYKDEEDKPTREYFEQFTFHVGSKIKAYQFIKNGGKSTECLMADGSVKEFDFSGFASTDDLTNVAKKTDIPTKVSQLENDVPFAEYNKNNPVILFSGSIHSNNNDGSLTYQPWAVRPNLYSQHNSVQGLEFSYYEVNGEKKPMLVIKVNPKDGYTVKPTSVQSSVTLNTHWNPSVDFGGNRRSQGFWTTGGVFVDGNIYVSVWRTHDDNNDSTTNDCIAWSVQEMNITIFGLGYKNS